MDATAKVNQPDVEVCICSTIHPTSGQEAAEGGAPNKRGEGQLAAIPNELVFSEILACPEHGAVRVSRDCFPSPNLLMVLVLTVMGLGTQDDFARVGGAPPQAALYA